ncbi:MAG: ATPase domain-containing protein, partial [Thermoplasmata archaeon]
ELRQEMFRFARYLKSKKVTAILITETPRYQQSRRTRYNIEQFIGDSFIHLDLEKKGGEFRRSVTILKMRLCRHDAGTHPFLITPKGMEVQHDVVL